MDRWDVFLQNTVGIGTAEAETIMEEVMVSILQSGTPFAEMRKTTAMRSFNVRDSNEMEV